MHRLPVLLLLSAVPLLSQSQSNAGDVRGVVLDPSGAAVRDASLTVLAQDRGFRRSAASDTDGAFAFLLLPPGRYQVRVEAPNFAAKVVDGVEVRVGDAVALRIRMTLSTVASEVQVLAEAEVVESERIQQANTIEQERIANLPINRRNYLDFALLAPGVFDTTSVVDEASFRPIAAPQSGLSFGGSNGRGNNFYVDGVENYNNSGGVRLSLTQEMIQEFQINRNSYAAEFGNATGGVVNIISRSGTNTLHGNMFGFLRHREIQARNYFDTGKSAFTRVQAGATLGGPIRKDRTFFFAGLERLDRQESNFIPLLQDRGVLNRLTPSQQQLVDFFLSTGNPQIMSLARQAQQLLTPSSNATLARMFQENAGVFPFAEDLTLFAARLDHRFSEKHNLFFRASVADNLQENSTFGALDAYNRGRSLDWFDGTLTLGDAYVFNSRWLMDTRLMINYGTLHIMPVDPLGPEVNIAGFGFFNRQSFLPYHGIERHYQAIQNFTYATSRHQLKFGYDFNPMRNGFESGTFFGGRFGFGENIPLATALVNATGDTALPATLGAFLTAAGRANLVPSLNTPISALQAYSLGYASSYQQAFGNPNYVNFIKRLHFYVQDSWKAHRDLTVTMGLRYENEFHNPVIPPDRNNVGPRFGFAWSPGESRLVVRGGYGLYYGQITSNAAGTADPLSGKYINQVFIPLSGVAGINNPQTGRTLTSVDIYQTLLRQGVIGTRPVRESDLAQFGLRAAPGLPFSVIFGIDPNLQNPWAHQASFEVEKAIGNYSLSVAYNFNRGAHLARFMSNNVRYSGERLPDGRPTFVRLNPLLLQSNVMRSDFNSFYHAGLVQLTRRFSRGFTINTHYTLSKAIDEFTDFNSDYSPNDQLNARADRGLSSFHQKHRFVLNAVYLSQARGTLLRGWNVSPIIQANSWRPFNVLTGVDLPSGGDGYVNTKRPAHLGRNMGRGPNFFTWDMRLSRRFALGSETRMLEFIAEGFNLLNRTNFRTVNNVVGDVPISALPNPIEARRGAPTQPLSYTSTLNPRQFQLGLKLFF